MFKVIDLPPEGKPAESLDTSRVAPPPEGTFRWIELVETDDEALKLLQERFRFHPLAIEDCASFELHSKLEEYPDYLFVVLHTFTSDSDEPSEIDIHEIHAFVGQNYLVTVHDRPVPAAEDVWRRATRERETLERGPGWALYRTADAMVDAVFPMLEEMASELEVIEESVLTRAREEDLAKIFQLRSTLVSMRRVIRPVRDVVGMLSRRTEPPLSERTALYFRDVYDHVLRCAEQIEEDLGLVSNAMDAYLSAVSQRTNEIMARLTIFSVIFLPLAFVTGFFGQNFEQLPFDSSTVFLISLGIMAVIPVGLLIWFSRKGWL